MLGIYNENIPTIRLIMLNGPAGSGKDKFVEIYTEMVGEDNVKHLKFASDLAVQTRRKAGVDKETWDKWYASQESKNSFKDELGCSPRQAMIETSYWTKYYAGQDCYSKATAQRVEEAIRQGYKHILISDLGYQEELEYMCSYDLSETLRAYRKLYLIQAHTKMIDIPWISKELVTIFRDGHTFDGDSRLYTYGVDRDEKRLVRMWGTVRNEGDSSYINEVSKVLDYWTVKAKEKDPTDLRTPELRGVYPTDFINPVQDLTDD